MDYSLENLISVITTIKDGNQFKKYIDFILFPFYRNLEVNTKIRFEFPLTVFIGQNGCGKSSCLHALYGAPDRYTPYRFWFDTKVDPIVYYDDQKRRHSFWYSYRDENQEYREVVKARIKRDDDPNYWETSRPLVWAGMKRRRRGNRDKPIRKNVVYLDFRSELSAFDKFFYFGNLKNSNARNKQEFIRRKSISLKKLFTQEAEFISSSTRNLNKPIENLTSDELKWISYILNRKYTSGISVWHELFRNEGYSILFETDFAKYSEAFAGSGEMAVVRLVKEVLAAENYSLILLDEPEVSLHPGAQHRLKIFLLEQIKIKKHQIILTSHSPTLITGLPQCAIKSFIQQPNSGRFFVKEGLTALEAFYHIEFPFDNKKNIIVEDILAKEIIEGVLEKLGPETKNIFNVKYNSGGESVIKKEFITVYCQEENSNNYVFLDGDQKIVDTHFDWRNFSSSDLNVLHLKAKIKEQNKEDIKFSIDGGSYGGNTEQQVLLLKRYLEYYLTNVYYLPKNIPEEVIYDEEFALTQIRNVLNNEEQANKVIDVLNNISNVKHKFALIAKTLQGDDKAENIQSIHRMFIQKWIHKGNSDFCHIKSAITKIKGI